MPVCMLTCTHWKPSRQASTCRGRNKYLRLVVDESRPYNCDVLSARLALREQHSTSYLHKDDSISQYLAPYPAIDYHTVVHTITRAMLGTVHRRAGKAVRFCGVDCAVSPISTVLVPAGCVDYTHSDVCIRACCVCKLRMAFVLHTCFS